MSKISDKQYIFINGEYFLPENAVISVRDRGFRFGDGIYETIGICSGVLYRWDVHFARLQASLELVRISTDLSSLEDSCKELIKRNKIKNGVLRIQITRGEGSRGYLPENKARASLVVETVNALKPITDPVDLWVSSYAKIPDTCLPSAAKTTQGLSSTLAKMEAEENNCFESLLLGVDSNICEGASSSIFWSRGDTLYTPSLECGILQGTIRDLVIRIAPVQVVEGEFNLAQLLKADEVFLTNAVWHLVPVKTIKPGGIVLKKFALAEKIRQLILQDMEEYALARKS